MGHLVTSRAGGGGGEWRWRARTGLGASCAVHLGEHGLAALLHVGPASVSGPGSEQCAGGGAARFVARAADWHRLWLAVQHERNGCAKSAGRHSGGQEVRTGTSTRWLCGRLPPTPCRSRPARNSPGAADGPPGARTRGSRGDCCFPCRRAGEPRSSSAPRRLGRGARERREGLRGR